MDNESLKSLKLMLKQRACYWANVEDEYYLFSDGVRIYKSRIIVSDKLVKAFVAKFLAIPSKNQCLMLEEGRVKEVESKIIKRFEDVLNKPDLKENIVTNTMFLKKTENGTVRFLRSSDIYAINENYFAPLNSYKTIYCDSKKMFFTGEDEVSTYSLLSLNYGDAKEEIKKVFFEEV